MDRRNILAVSSISYLFSVHEVQGLPNLILEMTADFHGDASGFGFEGAELTYHFVLTFLFLSLEPEKLSKQKIATTPLFSLLALRFLFGVTEQEVFLPGKG
jgi:hypothetical protein